MASPLVAGIVSLAWSVRPDLNAASIKSAILSGGDILPSLSGKILTKKRINAYKILQSLQLPPPEYIIYT